MVGAVPRFTRTKGTCFHYATTKCHDAAQQTCLYSNAGSSPPHEQSSASNVLRKWYDLVAATNTATKELPGSKLVVDSCKELREIKKSEGSQNFLEAARVLKVRGDSRRRVYEK